MPVVPLTLCNLLNLEKTTLCHSIFLNSFSTAKTTSISWLMPRCSYICFCMELVGDRNSLPTLALTMAEFTLLWSNAFGNPSSREEMA
jgi:hypothetical protein